MSYWDCGCSGNYPTYPYGPGGNPHWGQQIPPAAPPLVYEEPVASQLQNLELNLFGPFTVTVVRGRGVWSGLCSASAQIAGIPRNANEGLICYLLRVMGLLVSGQGNGYFTAYIISVSALVALPTANGAVPLNAILPVMNLITPGQLAFVQLLAGGANGYIPTDYNASTNNFSYKHVL